MPVGQLTPKQMLRVAEIADLYGSGEIRLTVWQNFIIPNVADTYVETVTKALRRIGLDTRQSFLRGGLVACTGNSYCKFASSNTKAHALELASYLEKRVELDQPINIHLTGCPNSCAQHYMGDIGLLGTKVKVSGESLEGYHVFVGGGFGGHGNEGFESTMIAHHRPARPQFAPVPAQRRRFCLRSTPGKSPSPPSPAETNLGGPTGIRTQNQRIMSPLL